MRILRLMTVVLLCSTPIHNLDIKEQSNISLFVGDANEPILTIELLEVPNLTRFFDENHVVVNDTNFTICLNGWWLVYENEAYNSFEKGRIDLVTGYNCLNDNRRIGSMQAFSYTEDFKPQLITTFPDSGWQNKMNHYGLLMDFVFLEPRHNARRNEYIMKSAIITGGQAWTLYNADWQFHTEGICFVPSVRENSACFLKDVAQIGYPNGYPWTKMKLGCQINTIPFNLTDCYEKPTTIIDVQNKLSQDYSVQKSNCENPNSIIHGILNLLHKKIHYNISPVSKFLLSDLNPVVQWKIAIVNKVFSIFKLQCRSKWIDEAFVNLMENFYVVYLNSSAAIMAAKKSHEGLNAKSNGTNVNKSSSHFTPTLWKTVDTVLNQCLLKNNIRPLNLSDSGSSGKIRFLRSSRDKASMEIANLHEDSEIEKFNNFNEIIDTAWWAFTTVFAVCVADDNINSKRQNLAMHFMVGTEKIFFAPLREQWLLKSTDEATFNMYRGNLYNGVKRHYAFNHNIKACAYATYQDLHLQELRPKRPILMEQ